MEYLFYIGASNSHVVTVQLPITGAELPSCTVPLYVSLTTKPGDPTPQARAEISDKVCDGYGSFAEA